MTKLNLRLNLLLALLTSLCCLAYILLNMHAEYVVGEIENYYLWQMAEYLLALFAIPTALKMMSLTSVRNRIQEGGAKTYFRLAALRLVMLYLPIFLGVCLYCITIEVSFVYCVLMCVLALLFVLPSESRQKREMMQEEPNEDDAQ